MLVFLFLVFFFCQRASCQAGPSTIAVWCYRLSLNYLSSCCCKAVTRQASPLVVDQNNVNLGVQSTENKSLCVHKKEPKRQFKIFQHAWWRAMDPTPLVLNVAVTRKAVLQFCKLTKTSKVYILNHKKGSISISYIVASGLGCVAGYLFLMTSDTSPSGLSTWSDNR